MKIQYLASIVLSALILSSCDSSHTHSEELMTEHDISQKTSDRSLFLDYIASLSNSTASYDNIDVIESVIDSLRKTNTKNRLLLEIENEYGRPIWKDTRVLERRGKQLLITPSYDSEAGEINGLFYSHLPKKGRLTIRWVPGTKNSNSTMCKTNSVLRKYLNAYQNFEPAKEEVLPEMQLELKSSGRDTELKSSVHNTVGTTRVPDDCWRICVEGDCTPWRCPTDPPHLYPPLYPPQPDPNPPGGGGGGPGNGGGNNGGPDEPCNTGNPVLDDPDTQEAFDDLWDDSNFGSKENPNPESERVEKGGFLVPDGSGGYIFQRLPSHLVTSSHPCRINFKVPVGLPSGSIFVHTHPYTNGETQNHCIPGQQLTYKNNVHRIDRQTLSRMGLNEGLVLDADKIIPFTPQGIKKNDVENRCGY